MTEINHYLKLHTNSDKATVLKSFPKRIIEQLKPVQYIQEENFRNIIYKKTPENILNDATTYLSYKNGEIILHYSAPIVNIDTYYLIQSIPYPVNISKRMVALEANKYFLYGGNQEPRYIGITENQLQFCNITYNNFRACNFTNQVVTTRKNTCETQLMEGYTSLNKNDCSFYNAYPDNVIAKDMKNNVYYLIINTPTTVDIICPQHKLSYYPLKHSSKIIMNTQCNFVANNETLNTYFPNATKIKFPYYEIPDNKPRRNFLKDLLTSSTLIHITGVIARGTTKLTETMVKMNNMTMTDLTTNPLPVMSTIVGNGTKIALNYTVQLMISIGLLIGKILLYIIGIIIIISLIPLLIWCSLKETVITIKRKLSNAKK